MMSQEERLQFDELVRKVEELVDSQKNQRRIYQTDVAPNEIKQRHIDGRIIFVGLDADLPDDGLTQIKAYWATDTGKLYIWDGSDWLSATLT